MKAKPISILQDAENDDDLVIGKQTPTAPIVYKEFYNKGIGLPEPLWGPKINGLQCPTCGSQDMYSSGHSDDPEEVFPHEVVRCKYCGRITDWFEALKQREVHPTDAPRDVIGRPE